MVGDFMALGSVGIELSVSVLVFAAIGYWLDGRLKTSPWLTMLGLVIGLITGLIGAYKVIVKSDIWEGDGRKRDDQSKNDD